ncbi:hypothetical protein LNP27_00855 [Flavobacterium galactosidilyticum]|uniref:hypothetical protein n=1 Tax=Flavobacterium galactosidilyticum TaxID=2893886 RepID=UPI001E2EDDF7|nr:hypothetical protein [Flavobacterium sp. F-340]UFH46609.1 hypothetical protein LNP27_00855 [Flavobacterium sp. F-340]
MKIFQKIFGKKKNTVENKNTSVEALKLVKVANTLAVSFYMPLVNEYPKLTLINDSGLLEEFDTLVTIASIGFVMTQIGYSYNIKETQEYISSINKEAISWNSESSKLIIEFGRYINDLTSKNKIKDLDELSEAIGAWVFIDLYSKNPHNIEIKEFANSRHLFFVLGTMITKSLSNYWIK